MTAPSRPLMLRGVMVIGSAMGVLGTIVGAWALVRLVTYDGPIRIGEVGMSRGAFLALAVPFLVLALSACLTLVAAAWSLWRQARVSRALLTALVVELVIGDAAMLVFMRRTLALGWTELIPAALSFMVIVAVMLWYLYGKRTVVAYYDALAEPAARPASP